MSVEPQQLSEPAASTRNAPTAGTAHSCPSCGTPVAVDSKCADEAARVIRELQAQLESLKEQAAAAGMLPQSTSFHSVAKNAHALCRGEVYELRKSDPHDENSAAAERSSTRAR